MANNPFDAIPVEEAPAANPFDEIPTGDLLEPTAARRVPAKRTLEGYGPISLPEGALQSTLGEVADLTGEMLTRKGLVTESGLPTLAPDLDTFRHLALDPFSQNYEENEKFIKQVPASSPEKLAVGALKGTEELARGIADFFTSPSGLAQIGLAATPLAPAVYAKWAMEMAHGALESGKQSIEDFKKKDWEALGKNLVGTAGAALGGFLAGKHGAKNLSAQAAEFAPRGTGIEPVDFKLPVLPPQKPTHDLNREFQKTHPGAKPIPTVEIETTPLDPATGLPLPSSAQVTLNKAAQRLADIQAQGGQPNAGRIPSPTGIPVPQVRPPVGQETPLRQPGEAPGAKVEAVPPPENPPVKLAPEVEQFMADFYDPTKKVTNASNDPAVMTTEKAGMAVKSLDDLKALAEMDARNKAELAALKAKREAGEKLTPEEQARYLQIGMRVQFPREIIETATNSGSWSEANGTRVGRPLPNRPLDWKKNPEVEKWLRENGERIGIKLEDVKVEPIEDFKARIDAEKAAKAAKPPEAPKPAEPPSPEIQGAGQPPEAGKVTPPVVGEPPAAPAGFPVMEPSPKKADLKPGESVFKRIVENATKFKTAIGEWLKDKPENKAIVWEGEHGRIHALTRNIGDKPWRVTHYSPHKGGLMPTGHSEFQTRVEALADQARDVKRFHESIPGKVLTEQEIYGYKNMADIPDKSVLVWYKTNPKYAGTLFDRLKSSAVSDLLVRDSITKDGRVAFTDAVDPKTASLLRLTPEKLKDPAAESARVLELAKAAPSASHGVDATHLGKPERRQLIAKGMRFESDARTGRITGYYTEKARLEDARRAEAAKLPKPEHVIKQKSENRPTDIIDIILEGFGSIKLKSAIEGGGGDNYKGGYELAARNNPKSKFTGRKLFSENGTDVDVLVGRLIDEGKKTEGYTVQDLWNEIDRAHTARAEWQKGNFPEQQAQKFHAALTRNEKRTRSTEAVDTSEVQVGTQFKIEGETFEVTFIDLDTNTVTVKDGRRFGIQDIPEGAILRADKGSVKPPEGGPVEFVPDIPEEPTPPAEPVKPVEPPKPAEPVEPPKPVEAPKKDMTGKDLVDATGKDELKLVAEEGVDVAKAEAEKAQLAKDRAEAEARQPKFEGMGGAVPEEFTPGAAGDYVSNMFAAIDRDRIAMGKEPMEPTQRRTWDEDNQKALAKMNRDPGWIPSLIAEVSKRPRPLLSWENAGIVWHRAKLRAEANNAAARVNRAYEDGRASDLSDAKADLLSFEEQLLDLDNVVGRGGTGSEAGRSLQAQKMAAGEDFTLVEMRLQKRAFENDGKPLTPKQEAEVKAMHDEIQHWKQKFEEMKAQEAGLRAKQALEEIEREKNKPKASDYVISVAERWVKEWEGPAKEAEARLMKRLGRTNVGVDPTMISDLALVGRYWVGKVGVDVAKFGQMLVEKFGDSVKPYIQQAFDASRALIEKAPIPEAVKKTVLKPKVKDMTPEQRKARLVDRLQEKFDAGEQAKITGIIQQLARQGIEEGVRGWEGLLDYVHNIVAEIDPNFSRRDTMDAISGYGKYKQLSKDEISVALREAKGEMQQVAKIEDITSGIPPKPTGIERRTPSAVESEKIKIVNELKKKHPELFEGSGLKSSLESRKKYYQNRMDQMRKEIEARQLLIDKKTPPPVDAELAALKAEYEKVKVEHDAMVKQLRELDTAYQWEQAQKKLERERVALEESIAEQERRLRENDIAVKKRPVDRPADPTLEPLKQKRDALSKRIADARKKPAWQKWADKQQKQLEAMTKLIAEKEAKLAAGDKSTAARQFNRPMATAELEKAKQRLDELNAQIRNMRKPARSVEDIALQAFKTRTTKATAEYERRLAEGDFEPRKRKEIKKDPEAEQIAYRFWKAKEAWHVAMMKARLAKRSAFQKTMAAAGEVLNTSRAILTSGDFSAVLRQGGFIALGHPIRALKAMPAMFRAFRSEAGQHAINEQILGRKNYPLYQQSGLYLSSHGKKLSQMEEAYMTRWAEKIPFVAGSERAYVTFLNRLRADSFDQMAKSLSRTGEVTPKEAKAIANYINVATGRGNFGMKENALVGLNIAFFAPRYVASRFQLVAGQPLYGGTMRTRKMVAKEYARFLTGLAVIYGLAMMDGAEVETDPTSSDFGKLRYGNTRVDMMAGLQQGTVLLSRLGAGEVKNSKGQIVPIRGDLRPGQKDWADYLYRFGRSKLAPIPSNLLNLATGKDVVGQPVTLSSTAQNMLIPLSQKDIYDTMVEQGVPRGTALSMLSIFGAGLQNYNPDERARR